MMNLGYQDNKILIVKSENIFWLYIYKYDKVVFKFLLNNIATYFVQPYSGTFRCLNVLESYIYKFTAANLVTTSEFFFSFKLKFRRKGAWINFRKLWPQTVAVKFGYSHPIRYISNFILVRRYKKYLKYHAIIVLTPDKASKLKILNFLMGVRPLDLYNWRGVKRARSLLISKYGKESQFKKFKSKVF